MEYDRVPVSGPCLQALATLIALSSVLQTRDIHFVENISKRQPGLFVRWDKVGIKISTPTSRGMTSFFWRCCSQIRFDCPACNAHP